MKQIITHLDPWRDVAREFDSAVIIQKGSSITYLMPSLKIKYVPDTSQAAAMRKAYAFGVVRKEARQWLEAHEGVEVQRRKIIDRNENALTRGVFRNGYYCDVKAAYWETAKRNGVITFETFEKFKADKFIRNACIGALASKSHIYTWSKETGERKFIETIEPDTTKAYWFISSFVAERMAFGLPYYLFFWVDCAYSETQEGVSFMKNSFPPSFDFTEKTFSFVRWNAKEQTAFARFPDGNEKPYFFQKFQFDFFDT